MLTGLSLLVLAACAGADPERQAFPYRALITASEATVRSGPGRQHFATGNLEAGSEVEVHRIDGRNWLAIRPPEGSFSWVASEHCTEPVRGVAYVRHPGVTSLVGSQLDDQRGAFQVILEPGEALAVLEEVQRETDAGRQLWLKIAPPAGEFRWIHADDVSEHAAAAEPVDSPPSDDATESAVDATAASYDTPAETPSDSPETAPQREWSSARRELSRPAEPQPSSKPELPDEQTIADELDALELELSAMLGDSPEGWFLDPLRTRLDGLLLMPHRPADAQRAMALAGRLERFAAVARAASGQREVAGRASRPGRARAVSRRRVAAPPSGAPVIAAAPQQSQHDASGTLRPVIAPGKADGPPYAVVDSGGRPLAFVVPGVGIDLRPYVGQRVGVDGIRGFDTVRRAPLVRAQRVTLLGEALRR